jgi:hypothetical protein
MEKKVIRPDIRTGDTIIAKGKEYLVFAHDEEFIYTEFWQHPVNHWKDDTPYTESMYGLHRSYIEFKKFENIKIGEQIALF